MAKRDPGPVSRAQLAEYAEVSRAAVTNWGKRAADFPKPVDEKNGLFNLDQVTDWLSARAIPANARHPHEPVGITYADRVRANAAYRGEAKAPHDAAPATPSAGPNEDEIQRRVWRMLDRLRGPLRTSEACNVLLGLLHMCAKHEAAWRELVHFAEHGGDPADLPDEPARTLSRQTRMLLSVGFAATFADLITEIARLGTGDDHRRWLAAAFDHLLAMWEEGRNSGILRTPSTVVETAVSLLAFEAAPRHIHDPFCRTGEFLVAMDQRLRDASSSPGHRLSGVNGHVEEAHTARMNLGIHEVEAEILHSPVDPGVSPDLPRADIVVTNPPFNRRLSPRPQDRHLPYGHSSNETFAWLQHAVALLAPGGRAGVVMPPNAAFSTNSREMEIRSAMVEDGVVEAVVGLPDRLFAATAIPVNLWLLRRPEGSCSEVLFIDASQLGMVSRARRSLRAEDVCAIDASYRAWRRGTLEKERPAFARAARIAEVRDRQYSLQPSSYIADPAEDVGAAVDVEGFDELTRRLCALEAQMPEADERTRVLLQEIHRWMR